MKPVSLQAYHRNVFPLGHDDEWSVNYIAGIVEGGFPNPADDYIQIRLELSKLLETNRSATYYFQLTGKSMMGRDLTGEVFSMPHGALLHVDRSLKPLNGDIVLGHLQGNGWTVKFYQKSKIGNVTLMPANPAFEPIFLTEEVRFDLFGVVVWYVVPANGLARNRVKHIGLE